MRHAADYPRIVCAQTVRESAGKQFFEIDFGSCSAEGDILRALEGTGPPRKVRRGSPAGNQSRITPEQRRQILRSNARTG